MAIAVRAVATAQGSLRSFFVFREGSSSDKGPNDDGDASDADGSSNGGCSSWPLIVCKSNKGK